MYIPIWVILIILFLIAPDLAFIIGIIYFCFVHPLTAVCLVLIYLLLILFNKGFEFWEKEINPRIEKITKNDLFIKTKGFLIKAFVWSFYGMSVILFISLLIFLIFD